MSRWGPTDAERDRRLARAQIVARYTDVSVTEYLAHRSRADPFEVSR